MWDRLDLVRLVHGTLRDLYRQEFYFWSKYHLYIRIINSLLKLSKFYLFGT